MSHEMLRKNNVTVDAFFISVFLDPCEELSPIRCSSYLPSQCVICLICHIANLQANALTHFVLLHPRKHEEQLLPSLSATHELTTFQMIFNRQIWIPPSQLVLGTAWIQTTESISRGCSERSTLQSIQFDSGTTRQVDHENLYTQCQHSLGLQLLHPCYIWCCQ